MHNSQQANILCLSSISYGNEEEHVELWAIDGLNLGHIQASFEITFTNASIWWIMILSRLDELWRANKQFNLYRDSDRTLSREKNLN